MNRDVSKGGLVTFIKKTSVQFELLNHPLESVTLSKNGSIYDAEQCLKVDFGKAQLLLCFNILLCFYFVLQQMRSQGAVFLEMDVCKKKYFSCCIQNGKIFIHV